MWKTKDDVRGKKVIRPGYVKDLMEVIEYISEKEYELGVVY